VFALTLRTASVCSIASRLSRTWCTQLPRGADDIVEILKITNEQGFSRSGLRGATAVGHWLPAAGLVERVLDLDAEALQELERGDPDVRVEGVDVARNKKADSHGSPLLGARSVVLSARADFALENDVNHDGVDKCQRQHHDTRSPEDECKAARGCSRFVDG
jgi:hypothetical protein